MGRNLPFYSTIDTCIISAVAVHVARRPFLSLFTLRALRNWAFLSRYSRSQDPIAVSPGPIAGCSSLALHVAVRPRSWVFLSRLHVAVRPVTGCSSLALHVATHPVGGCSSRSSRSHAPSWAFLSRLHVAVCPVAGRFSLTLHVAALPVAGRSSHTLHAAVCAAGNVLSRFHSRLRRTRAFYVKKWKRCENAIETNTKQKRSHCCTETER